MYSMEQVLSSASIIELYTSHCASDRQSKRNYRCVHIIDRKVLLRVPGAGRKLFDKLTSASKFNSKTHAGFHPLELQQRQHPRAAGGRVPPAVGGRCRSPRARAPPPYARGCRRAGAPTVSRRPINCVYVCPSPPTASLRRPSVLSSRRRSASFSRAASTMACSTTARCLFHLLVPPPPQYNSNGNA